MGGLLGSKAPVGYPGHAGIEHDESPRPDLTLRLGHDVGCIEMATHQCRVIMVSRQAVEGERIFRQRRTEASIGRGHGVLNQIAGNDDRRTMGFASRQ